MVHPNGYWLLPPKPWDRACPSSLRAGRRGPRKPPARPAHFHDSFSGRLPLLFVQKAIFVPVEFLGDFDVRLVRTSAGRLRVPNPNKPREDHCDDEEGLKPTGS